MLPFLLDMLVVLDEGEAHSQSLVLLRRRLRLPRALVRKHWMQIQDKAAKRVCVWLRVLRTCLAY